MKERLIGAAVLVAIGVWLVPWVLDGPESGVETPAGSLQLPSAEEPMPMRTQTLRLGGDAPESAAEATPPAATPPAATPPVEASEAAAEPGRTAGTAAEPEVTEPEPTRVAEARPESAAPAAVAPPSPAPATSAKPPAAATGDWTVQLGSFSEEANARRLAQRAGTFGHKAEVSSHRSGARTLYRVRVGPQATRAAADAAASSLRAHGLDARVVAAR